MKKSLILLFTCLIFLSAFAANPETEEILKQEFEKMLEYCRSSQDDKVANYIVYRGDDEARRWKDLANYDNEIERERIVRFRKDIVKDYLKYTNIEYLKYMEMEQKGKMWYVLQVKFSNDTDNETVYFAFLKINGHFAIGDID